MAALPTILETISYAKLAIGLCAIDNSKGQLFGKRLTAPSSPLTQSIVKDALEWGYDGAAVPPTELREMANYLLWLINPYGITAQYIINNTSGGGSVVPPSSARPEPLDFVVSASSPIPTGSSTITVPAYKGWNLNFDRGGTAQNTTNVGDGGSYYTWNRDTATFVCVPEAYEGELFRLSPI